MTKTWIKIFLALFTCDVYPHELLQLNADAYVPSNGDRRSISEGSNIHDLTILNFLDKVTLSKVVRQIENMEQSKMTEIPG